MKKLLVLGVILACGDNGPNTVTLHLSTVDDKTLPVVLPSSGGTVQVLSGRLVGSRTAALCTYTIALTSGGSPSGPVDQCSLDPGDVVDLDLDLGGAPAPSGVHHYRFGP